MKEYKARCSGNQVTVYDFANFPEVKLNINPGFRGFNIPAKVWSDGTKFICEVNEIPVEVESTTYVFPSIPAKYLK